jgi:3-hydroxyisobutyrate dehydrogenase-like beta-hydroxyacid dehydrogenase
MTTLGFIGLGRMGGPMAARLLKAGHQVIGYDIDAAAAERFAASGGEVADTIAAVAQATEIVFLSLPTPDIVIGATQSLGGAVRICVDLSTSGPAAAARIFDALGARAIASIDAPVSGGIPGAVAGKLALMGSGPEAAWNEIEPLLRHFGTPFFMGEVPGAGQTMKLVNNLMGACAIAITAEGMTIGAKAGLDPARMIDVLNVSSGRNSGTLDKWPKVGLTRSFDWGFATGLCLKDVRLCLAEAEALGVPLGVGSAVAALLERTAATLGGDSDFTEMARIVEGDAGLDPNRSI